MMTLNVVRSRTRVLARVAVLLLGVGLVSCAWAAGDSCTDVVALSKVTQDTVSDQSFVESHARRFCKAYQRSQSSGSTFNAGASYDFLAGTLGSSHASLDEVASHYCDAENDDQARSDAFHQYIETIAPGAYDAYKACVADTDVTFDTGGSTPTEFTLTYHYVPHNQTSDAVMTYSTSSDMTCHWDNGTGKTQTTPYGGQGVLTCSRPKSDVQSFVTVARTNGGGVMTIPLPKYNSDGVPDATVKMMEGRLSALESSNLPYGSIIPWYETNLPVPTGWIKCDGSDTRCPSLVGRVLRGDTQDKVGTRGGSDTADVPWLGSNVREENGDGWSMQDKHFESKENRTIKIIPSYTAVFFIMKVENPAH